MLKHNGHRLRTGRYSEQGRIYLITTVTHKREPFFSDLFLGRIIVRAFRNYHLSGHVQSLAFVVMPDHIHWLVQLNEGTSLSRLMQLFKGYTSRQINGLPGSPQTTLWQHSFHDHAIRKDEDIKGVARYIVANPLRARLVEKIEDYPLWDAIWL